MPPLADPRGYPHAQQPAPPLSWGEIPRNYSHREAIVDRSPPPPPPPPPLALPLPPPRQPELYPHIIHHRPHLPPAAPTGARPRTLPRAPPSHTATSGALFQGPEAAAAAAAEAAAAAAAAAAARSRVEHQRMELDEHAVSSSTSSRSTHSSAGDGGRRGSPQQNIAHVAPARRGGGSGKDLNELLPPVDSSHPFFDAFPFPRSLLQNCPIPVHQVIDMEIERFNDVCVRFGFSEEAIARLRDVRRKGKNRQAARKSREKKIKTMDVLR